MKTTAVGAFKRLLKDYALVESEKGDKSFRLIEKEKRSSNAGYEVLIYSCPKDTIAINCNYLPDRNKIFKSDMGVCRKSDYILISTESMTVIAIELKKTYDESKDDKTEEIRQQLTTSACFLDYCESIIGLFWGDKDILKGYSKHYVVCVPEESRKMPFYTNSQPPNNTPDSYIPVFGDEIHFHRLMI